MHYREVTTDRQFLARLETGADWREEIESLADEVGIQAGWFVGMGAVSDAELWYYDQEEGQYHSIHLDEPLEVAACVGNVSWMEGSGGLSGDGDSAGENDEGSLGGEDDESPAGSPAETDDELPAETDEDSPTQSDAGERFAHTHAVLSRRSGQTLAGHLNAGTVFAAEVFLVAFEEPLEREYHEETDLDLWL
jgi:hypothetical protein